LSSTFHSSFSIRTPQSQGEGGKGAVKLHDPSAQLILASASPRRRELLGRLGIPFRVIPSDVTEAARAGESPAAYALRVAREKALDVAHRHPGCWVLGADTIVTVDGQILGKPRDAADGHRMLTLLSGRAHQVMTAFVLVGRTGTVFASQVVTSQVAFRPLTDEQIHAYLATGEPFDKAGAYAVQGRGATLVERVEGSYTNVVGLPMDEVRDTLRAAGVSAVTGVASG
jgi:septum formation protein